MVIINFSLLHNNYYLQMYGLEGVCKQPVMSSKLNTELYTNCMGSRGKDVENKPKCPAIGSLFPNH